MIEKWLPFLHERLLTLSQLPLAALISLDTLRNVLSTLGYPAVALFIMIESTGIPFPGETMLLLASFYAAVDHRLQIPIVIACAALGAIIGDNFGYLIGRTGGYALVQRFGHYVFLKPEHLQKAQNYFAKHGNKTVFFGRFIAILRAWAAFLAGINHMRWSTFLLYNAVGGILWSIIYGCLGFYAGRLLHDNFSAVENLAKTISWGGAALIILVVIAAYIIFRLRRKRHKEQHTMPGVGSTQTTSAQTPAALQPEAQEQSGVETNAQQNTLAADPPTTAIQTPNPTPENNQETPSPEGA